MVPTYHESNLNCDQVIAESTAMDYVLPFAYQMARRYLSTSNRRPRRNNVRKGRKRGLAKSRANVRNSAPTRSIMQGSFSGSIRNYYTVASSKAYYKSFTCGDLIGDQYASLAAQFTEVRINAARLYFYPSEGTTGSFSYAACLFDSTGSTSTTTPSFGEICASPGSVVRRAWQTAGFHWKWTEPSDCEFNRITNAATKLFVFQLAPNESASLGGELIVDASVTLRNQAGSVASSLVTHIELLSGRNLSVADWNAILKAARSLKQRIDDCGSRSADLSLDELELSSALSSG